MWRRHTLKVKSIWINTCCRGEERERRRGLTSTDFLRSHLDRFVGVAKVDLDTV